MTETPVSQPSTLRVERPQSLNHQPFAGQTPVFHIPVVLQLLETNAAVEVNKPNKELRLPSGTEVLYLSFKCSKLGNN